VLAKLGQGQGDEKCLQQRKEKRDAIRNALPAGSRSENKARGGRVMSVNVKDKERDAKTRESATRRTSRKRAGDTQRKIFQTQKQIATAPKMQMRVFKADPEPFSFPPSPSSPSFNAPYEQQLKEEEKEARRN
jgi:hypothetical protein